MIIFRSVLLVLLLTASVAAVPVPATQVPTFDIQVPVSVAIRNRADGIRWHPVDFQSTVGTIDGEFDPDNGMVEITSAFSFPGQTSSQTFLIPEVIDPGMDEVCDLSGCTPAIPPTIINVSYDLMLTVDEFSGSVTHNGVAGPFGLSTASVTYSSLIDALPATLSGSWQIDGPTESASGTWSYPVLPIQLPQPDTINIVRAPAISGPVTGWTGPQDASGWIFVSPAFNRNLQLASVDGREFEIGTVPEPKAWLLVGVVAVIGGIEMKRKMK